MKKVENLLVMFLLMAASAYTLNVNAQVSNNNEDEVYKVARPQSKEFVLGEVLFKLKDGHQANIRRAGGVVQSAGFSKLDKVLTEFGAQDMEQLLPRAKVSGTPRRAKAFNGSTVVERDLTQIYKVTLAEEKKMMTLEFVKQLEALDEVEFAEPNYKVYIMADDHIADNYSGNPMASQQWYLDAYGVKELWNKPIINKERPVIAIIDTGVDLTHPDLKDNLWTNQAEADGETGYDNDGNGFKGDVHGWDFINNTPNIRDNNMHGTHVAGIAAAANNGIGIVGANPQALIMPVSVMQSDGTGDVATIVKGIDYAVANGATVLNLSLGTYAYSSALRQALERAYQTAVIVAAAGNDNIRIHLEAPEICIKHRCDYGKMFPAAFSFVLGVQAITETGELAAFSNHDLNGNTFSSELTAKDPEGFNYELQAPGTNMLSTIPGGKYKSLQGTSMAAPLVAGAISALKMVKQYDTQEILWGDLLHSSNIAGACAITQRPAELDFLKLQFRDRKELGEETEEDYSDDGRVDAGETISIYPVIRTTFGEASNVKMHLEMGDEFEDPSTVEIITDENNKVDFGWHLDAYGKGVSANPLKLKVANNVADNRYIKMKIVATCDESNVAFEKSFVLVVDNMIKIHGFISENTTLTSDHVYYVDGDLAVLEGATLTIEPGTKLQFQGGRKLSIFGTLVSDGTPDKPIIFEGHIGEDNWLAIASKSSPRTVLRYCRLSHFQIKSASYGAKDQPYFENCVFSDIGGFGFQYVLQVDAEYSNIMDNYHSQNDLTYVGQMKYNNIVNNVGGFVAWNKLTNTNFFNLYAPEGEGVENAGYITGIDFFGDYQRPGYVENEEPSYLGTSREDLIRPRVYEFGNTPPDESIIVYTQVDLSNMRTTPIVEAHGLVWKVVVNGKDAQDEYEDLAPLGVGRHKFEVYFNRPMNKNVIPQISFGVRDPWTQQAVAEDGSWNEEGTIFTAYKTITGKTKSDGVCRIYVYGAEDDEYFEIPYEKTRFNINVQAAGSMATGFMAEAGMGKVNLTWNNENNNFDDAMGFNIYRYIYVEKDSLDQWGNNTGVKIIVPDTVRINQEIVNIEETAYTDYDVKPGETYHYFYKVLSTGLQEYDVSNVVAATPLTSTLGDANGSGSVDVADVITTVNYAAGMEPKPFIFEAADMNTDKAIDILDVIGIIQKILNPSGALALASIENTAVYTIENGVLYVESPVALAGVQVQLNMAEKKDVTTTEDLNDFEQVSTWLSDNDYLFLAYNMNGKTLSAGKHALLKIGDAEISQIRLSDAQGRNVTVLAGDGTTGIDAMGSKVQLQGGVFNLKGQKVAGKATDLQKLPKGVYIVNGEKVVK